ncbi:hypothetical protein KKA33_01885 [Patescibacteria group bacterium]|nr:hypothetical protein [Patescibacteria group bacterium]
MKIPRKIISLFVTPVLFLGSLSLIIPSAFAKGVDPEEKVYYYLSDHLGGVDAVLDEEGNVVERRDYLPYGSERMTEGNTNESYGFTGKELDEETGLYYYGARYYDPKIGRFASLDPLILGESEKPFTSVLANPQALNGYSYVLNNPLRYVDRNGEWQIPVHFDLSLYLGKATGLNDDQALDIAYNNQLTDINKNTGPWNKENGWKHFVNRDVAGMWLDEAISNKADLKTFGNLLHYYQDTYSHYDNGYKWTEGGHILDSVLSALGLSKNPDKTYDNIDQANAMAKDTFYYIRKYIKNVQGTGDLTSGQFDAKSDELWNNISNEVDTFNKAGDEAQQDFFGLNDYEKVMKEFVDEDK